MTVLGLIACIVLRALTAQAKVVDSFEECKTFFYKDVEPSGIDQNAKKICQKLENIYYATLYSVHHKIPLYSAYTFDPACASTSGRQDIWHLEPQISQSQSSIDHMVSENQNNQKLYKSNQAISSDYSDSGYDRGHLNPSSFQCSDGRKATFTLTNAAPMDACFNRIHWRNWERILRSFLLKQLVRDGKSATAFIVTGTVPDPNVRIPQDSQKVTVPSHIWTAVCYKHTDDTKSFSFGYIGRNQPAEPGISLMSVSDLNNRLSGLYSELLGAYQHIYIFADYCFGVNNKLHEVQSMFQKLTDLPVNQAVQMSSEIQNTYRSVKRTFSSDRTPEKKLKVIEMTVKLAFDSISTYYKETEDLKIFTGSSCLITKARPLVKQFVHDELRKREVSAGSDAVECQLVSEKPKTAADGSRCSTVSESDYSCYCYTEGKIKPCCSSPCLYREDLKGYRCYSGQKLIDCSPRYSLITVNGKRCLDDHPCATYGEDYYWCKIATASWEYCSPPLRYSKAKNGKYCRSNHACAKYGKRNTWCYTDDEGNYDKCCISSDCHSTVSGQTCRSDHPCGRHGEKYLWCYTDNKGNWQYCCTDCTASYCGV